MAAADGDTGAFGPATTSPVNSVSSEITSRSLQKKAVRLAKQRLRAFRAARRHTWLVRSLRFVLPVTIVGMLGVYGASMLGALKLRVKGGDLSVAKIVVTKDDLKMQGVTYSGAAKDGSKYDVKAREAAVDITQQGPVSLEYIEGDLRQLSGVATRVKSRRGVIDQKKGEMDLLDGVEIDASNGLKARMTKARVLNKEHRVIASDGVVADTPQGRIAAREMDMHTKTRSGSFVGDVTLQLQPSATAGARPQGAGLGRDNSAPLDIQSQRLDIDDTARTASFTGGVKAAQGESTIQASTLRVFYEGQVQLPGQPPIKAAVPVGASPANAAQRVTKLQAAGNVLIDMGAERRVMAETADFDVAGDKALFTGPQIEVTQGKNRLLGRRLSLDRTTGKSRLDAPADGKTPAGRIQTVFYQNEQKAAATAAPKPKAAPAASAMGGLATSFRADPNAPMDVQAESLDVDDTAKKAIYLGRVRVQQGDVTLQTSEMIASYTGDTGLIAGPEAPKAARPAGQKGPTSGPQISKIDAKGGVIVTSKEGQQASSQWATYDMKGNSILLGGGVKLVGGGDAKAPMGGAPMAKIDLTTGQFEMLQDPDAPKAALAASAPAEKSARGPDGLPSVTKDKSAIPAQPSSTDGCVQTSGRPCLIVYPKDMQDAMKAKKAGAQPGAPTPAAPVPKRAPTEGWQPSTSPSPVYRAN